MKIKVALLLAAASVLAGPRSANAAFVPQTSLIGASLNGGTVTASELNRLTFNDPVTATYASGTPATYSYSGQTTTVTASAGNTLERDQANNTYLDSNFANGTQLIAQCGYTAFTTGCAASGSTTIAFANPTQGFTVSADDFDTTQTYSFTATAYSGATLLGSVTASSLADNGSSPAVLAAVSTTPITRLVITSTAASSPDGDLVLGNIATVPEPASSAIIAVGLLGLTALRRRVRG